MARRRPNLIVLTSRLPWWAALVLGFAFWCVANGIATHAPLGAFGPAFEPILGLMGTLFAAACAIGAVLSLVVRLKERRLLDGQHSLDQIRSLTWRDFEHLMAEAFRREGYAATCTDPGPDGGVDLVLTRAGERWLVQCKQWRTQRVGVKPVRELAGVVAASGAAGAVFVTSGSYTAEAREFAQRVAMRLIDGEALAQMLDVPTSLAGSTVPSCPRCGSGLVRRVARRGSRADEAFLGCSTYPECRFTRDLG